MYRVERAIAGPQPAQRPHPPILVPASGEKRMLRIEKSVLLPASLEEDAEVWAPLVQGYAAYQGIPPEEAAGWMLLGTPSAVVGEMERYLAGRGDAFHPHAHAAQLEVLLRFAAEVMPAFR
jgi:alkanesulfonate monooxygenase SsuD/methylene tetrahydromethanopterin reductase-like flavin-dependent oxidoreductase (luciferase family)